MALAAAQRSLVLERFAQLRSRSLLASAAETIEGVVQDTPRRAVLDGVTSPAESALLRGVAPRALAAMGHMRSDPDASLAPLGSMAMSDELLGTEAGTLVQRLVARMGRLASAHGFDQSGPAASSSGDPHHKLEPANALLARLREPPAGMTAANPLGAAEGHYGYWAPHVDKANVSTYDVSAVLYLATAGEHFDGGEFVFNDSDAVDRTVEPRIGRLLLFNSGLENLHQVCPVVGDGDRLALSVWFTLCRGQDSGVNG
eukprot:gnl/TRDRNA2_/TRDRNA2_38675_c0_seq1.p1 gnl/TRDRNA2_/TRDRNA2_38675_c0~~gnl/TRDRNA2_/TRDRNA2_38675_c0_seq1.p1  ORF type:complete len:273 (-),score=36.35 gnl/TRDRNA2_/TRDRNA2_38675_c0_seq1:172-945(-)